MQTLRHLVCGTDFSEHAEQALELAIKLASDDASSAGGLRASGGQWGHQRSPLADA